MLREKFIFKIIPMLNPDGVINGNYRCNLSGVDLNRRWKNPSKILHPTVYAMKQLCKEFSKERELVLICDLHGHSRRKNIFMYGNKHQEDLNKPKYFPYIMGKIVDYFSYKNSKFSYSRTKEATARIALYKEVKIPNIFTMEASFCGASQGDLSGVHFNTDHFKLAGKSLFDALIISENIDVEYLTKKF